MSNNPFTKEANELRQKSERWEKLAAARMWVDSTYKDSELKITTGQFTGSGLGGYRDAMMVMEEFFGDLVPNKGQLLAWINSQLGDLTK